MKKLLRFNPIINFGNKLFRLRRWFYGIPVLIMLLNTRNLYYPLGSHFYDEVVEGLGLAITLIGAFLRFWASGSSQRAVIRKGKSVRFRYHQTGVFSIMRKPYTSGDVLIVLGLSLALIHPLLILLSMVLFSLCIIPSYFAQETILLNRYQDSYEKYRHTVPALIPSFKHWRSSGVRFRWAMAFRKESNTLAILCILYFFVEQFRELIIQGHVDAHPFWVGLAVVSFGFFLIAILLDGFLEELPEIPHWIDYD